MHLNKNKYSFLPTFELIERISIQKDVEALNYFISNRKLLSFGKKRVLLPDYLQKLRTSNYYSYIRISHRETHLEEKLDLIYDRTLQKFSVLKDYSNEKDGPHCDKQYESLLMQLNNYRVTNPNHSEFEIEKEIETRFKNMVIRHLSYSWLEVCRITNRLYQRYPWEFPNGTIELKKPRGIDGRDFKRWLKENISNPDPTLKNEKYRIQKEIDDWFGHSAFIDFDSIANVKHGQYDYEETEQYPEDLSTLVAVEKSANLNKLRPSIRSLGEEKVKQFVKKILEAILYNENNDISIANEFGISKATYSRFAGRDWNSNINGEVPDLWKNLAKIVVSNPILLENAIKLGIKPVIDNILKSSHKS